ncbi:50S ribosomal protein L19e [Halococcoides cellulosivorans]|uniref:Large ribosomal subunit protein eL19 n=1 Tax=Halococcoides cellulosivorans TaxID=1679096 RepID=A0A2R4X287_9EURY|nr:50S ribosomal protein L19e [Halococcoides cellulosivorans]AWB27920.1 50S ribosomal protein L19e [Halococcoides cellulosivorans]
MTDLSAQKRLAADVLDVGKNRLWFDPDAQDEIADAITRADIRELIDDGTIQADEPEGNSRGRVRKRNAKRAEGHRKGHGTRSGTAGGREDPSAVWTSTIRAQRNRLQELRDDGDLDRSTYRTLYDRASGGEFDSVADLERYIDDNYGD